jgi:shikimate dehydrogenase
MSIALIGFKHVGKSSFGRALATHLALPFADLDELIEAKAGRSVQALHKQDPEEFRAMEREVLKENLGFEGVLALGGGTPMHNQDLLEGQVCIHLTAGQTQVWSWIQQSGSQLFPNKEAFQESWAKRLPVYEALASLTLHNTNDYAAMLSSITFNRILGYPLAHSWTPRFHNRIYKDLGIPALMFAHASQQLSLDGLKPGSLAAVTMPFKEEILPHLDELDPLAQQLGAVNTVLFQDGKLKGFNTDWHGIAYALRHLNLHDKKVLLLGAGGAAKAVAEYSAQQGAQLFILNRDFEKAQHLAQKVGGQSITQDAIPADTFLAVNATPLDLPLGEIPPQAYRFDLHYNPAQTPFLQGAQPGKAISGLDMFVAQAVEQVFLWSGQRLAPELYLSSL